MSAREIITELSHDRVERLLYTALVRLSMADGEDAEMRVLLDLMARDARVQAKLRRQYPHDFAEVTK
jgi:hypothetical protein